MSFLRRRPIPYSPPPAEVLSAAELARVARWKATYKLMCDFGLDHFRDVEWLRNHLEFVGYLARTGRTE